VSHSSRSPKPRRRRAANINIRRRRRIALIAFGSGLFAVFAAITLLLARPAPAPQVSATASAPSATVAPDATAQPSARAATSSAIGAEPATPMPSSVITQAADSLFDPARISYAPDFYQFEIQAFLDQQPGQLKSTRFQVGAESQSFAKLLAGLSNLYSFNPQIMLALIQQQSGLLSSERPTPDQLAWALGYQGDGGQRRGLSSQIRWAARELRWATRDFAILAEPLPALSYADGSRQEVSREMGLSRYVLSRLLAPTTTPGQLPASLERFVAVYSQYFGDPRIVPSDWPTPAEPFLTRPAEFNAPVTSFFDHDTPFLRQNGSLHTYWGRSETDIAFAYDGHTGWDYAMAPPDKVLAAAPGRVVFAGNSDDGCASPARAVIIDHGNGYRTLYWHLYSIAVEDGQQVVRGTVLGIAGETGCAIGAHLHLQVQYLGRDVDPYGWCSTADDPWQLNPAGQRSVWLWLDMPTPCGPPPPGTIVVDDGGKGFSSSGEWQSNEIGYAGGSRSAATALGNTAEFPFFARSLGPVSIAIWQPQLPQAGRYRVLAYVPYALNGLDESQEVRYLVRSSEGLHEVTVNTEDSRNWWADLGTYHFDPAEGPMVSVSTMAGDERRGVWVDAVAWVAMP
jgi:murein DD-endopeptidase MepM/ murein hydrolase activator NlpD